MGALTVPTTERRLGIMNTGKVDISKAKASLAARGSSVRLFPGEALNFKKGRWYFGFNKEKRKRVKDNSQFVMNLANTVETWQTFVDGKPRFAPLAYIINGESRAPREDMGMTDESKWDTGDDGNAMDPVQAITVCPIRSPKGTELNHITLSSVSARIAFDRLLSDWIEQYEANPGKLPIVELTEAEERSRKGSSTTYLAPTFEIVGWEKTIPADNPEGGIEVAQPEEEEEAPRARKATASAKPALDGQRASKRAPEPVDEDEEPEEDEEEVTDLRGKKLDHSRGNAAVAVSKKARQPEPEEDEDDEDDRPRAVSRSTVKPAPVVAAKRKPAPVEEPEEEEEAEQPVRRKRRAALN